MERIGYKPPQNLDAVFLALGDPTRRAILARLAKGEASVGELAEPFAMSQPAVSKHLRVLERAEKNVDLGVQFLALCSANKSKLNSIDVISKIRLIVYTSTARSTLI